jgi:hypothetical protein
MVVEVSPNKVTTIEAFGDGVDESQIDSFRFYEGKSHLYSVKGATQLQKDNAIAWIKRQIGRGYNAISPTWDLHYDDNPINCSTLVFGAYYKAGINLTGNNISILEWVAPANIARSNKLERKPVYFKAYEFESEFSGKVLDVPNSSTSDGTQLIQYQRNGQTNQRFIQIPAASYSRYSGRHEVRFVMPYVRTNWLGQRTTLMLDIHQPGGNAGGNNGNKLQIIEAKDSANYNTFWYDTSTRELKTKVSNWASSIHLATSDSKENGIGVHQWELHNTNRSRWYRYHTYNYS